VLPSPSPAGVHFVQSIGGWPAGGLVVIVVGVGDQAEVDMRWVSCNEGH
jgi:hypothetical protein